MSGRLPDAWLDELRSRSSLEEVVSEYVPLKQKGRRFWGCCPFHSEKTPSFSVDTQEQMYYCFGCHKGGTVINFVMDMERMEFMDAVRYLAARAHMDVPETGPSKPGESKTSRDEREQMYEANRLAAHFFHDLLYANEGAEALNYLYSRGLNDGDIRRFGLGASPKGWDGLLKHLEGQGFTSQLLAKAGLVVLKEGRGFDMFRNRAMFPIISAQGKVLGFGGRAMGDAQPKYLNTAETPIFNKRMGLYALNFAQKERSVGRLVLVEGYMDTVSLRKYGVQGVVATLGTALTEEQAKLMKRYAPEVWISYDGDAAGQKAALRALDIFDRLDIPARVIDYPDGMDPDDFVKAQGLSGFEALPKYDSTSYRMLRARDGLDVNTQEGMTQYAMRCCEILKNVKNPIEVENHLRRLVNETGYDRETLVMQIGVLPQAASAQIPTVRHRRKAQATPSDAALAEQALLTLISRGLVPAGYVETSDFSGEIQKALAGELIAGRAVNGYVESIADDDRRAEALRALNYAPIPEAREDAIKMAEECIQTIRRARKSRRVQELQGEIDGATPEQKKALYAQMAAMLQEEDG